MEHCCGRVIVISNVEITVLHINAAIMRSTQYQIRYAYSKSDLLIHA